MNRKRNTIQLMTATGLICQLLTARIAGADQIAGLVADEPGAALVKRFRVPAGSVVTGIEFVNNDDRITFPRVALFQGPASRLSEAILLAELTDVVATTPHRVRLSIPPTEVESAKDLYVAVSFPASTGIRRTGDGAGIGATQLSTFGDCYVAPTKEEGFQEIDLDLAITVLYRSVGKAENPSETRAVVRTFLGTTPNPSTSVARVQFGLDRPMMARIAIYNVAGRLIRLLAEGPMDPGLHSLEWDGKDQQGQDVGAGVYIAKLQAGGKVLTQKMVLAK